MYMPSQLWESWSIRIREKACLSFYLPDECPQRSAYLPDRPYVELG